MKKIVFGIVAAVIIATGFTSCTSNSPKPVAEKFLNSFWHMDYKEAKTVSTDVTKDMLDMLEQVSTTMPDSAKQTAKRVVVTIKDVKESGDKAVVTFTTSEIKEEKQINLVKKDGKWLVNLTKNDDFSSEASTPDSTSSTTPPDVGRNEADAAQQGDTVKK